MKVKFILTTAVAAVLTACGGGGGGGSTTPAAIAPTVTVTIDKAKVRVGETAVLTWSSTNATSCTGLDSTSAGIKSVSGTEVITATAGGQFKYTISCDGNGGTAKQTAALTVPMPVQKSSYLNAKNINIAPQVMPRGNGFRSDEGITAGHAYGDFFQDGSYSMIAASNVFAGSNGYGSTVAGKIYFFKMVNGTWTDATSQLLGLNDRTGCISPRKAIVADFNGDRKPDVFIACHGIDGNVPPGYSQGENPRYLLSQADGTYKNIDAGFNCYCHGATAFDFNGNGFADVIVADPVVIKQPAYLTNNQNGTFTMDKTRFAAELNPYGAGPWSRPMWSVELIDVDTDGKADFVAMGSENPCCAGQPLSGYVSTIYKNDGTNNFKNVLMTLPTNTTADNTLDILIKDGKIAMLRVDAAYSKMLVEIYSVVDMRVVTSTLIPGTDAVWFTLYNGNIAGSFTSNSYTIAF